MEPPQHHRFIESEENALENGPQLPLSVSETFPAFDATEADSKHVNYALKFSN